MEVLKVEPLRYEKTRGFVTRATGCNIETWNQPIYPESVNGPRLRELRVHHAQLTLGEAAKRLGITAAELCGLEKGSLTLSDAEWAALFEALGKTEWR